jgi:hypothetical protein
MNFSPAILETTERPRRPSERACFMLEDNTEGFARSAGQVRWNRIMTGNAVQSDVRRKYRLRFLLRGSTCPPASPSSARRQLHVTLFDPSVCVATPASSSTPSEHRTSEASTAPESRSSIVGSVDRSGDRVRLGTRASSSVGLTVCTCSFAKPGRWLLWPLPYRVRRGNGQLPGLRLEGRTVDHERGRGRTPRQSRQSSRLDAAVALTSLRHRCLVLGRGCSCRREHQLGDFRRAQERIGGPSNPSRLA